jgi:hypothetical protein
LRAVTDLLEGAREESLLGRIDETGEPRAGRPAPERSGDAGRTSEFDHGDAAAGQVEPAPPGDGFDGGAVARALDEHERRPRHHAASLAARLARA